MALPIPQMMTTRATKLLLPQPFRALRTCSRPCCVCLCVSEGGRVCGCMRGSIAIEREREGEEREIDLGLRSRVLHVRGGRRGVDSNIPRAREPPKQEIENASEAQRTRRARERARERESGLSGRVGGAEGKRSNNQSNVLRSRGGHLDNHSSSRDAASENTQVQKSEPSVTVDYSTPAHCSVGSGGLCSRRRSLGDSCVEAGGRRAPLA